MLSKLFNSPYIVSLFIIFIILLLGWEFIYINHIDNHYYVEMSKGEFVMKPFSARILYPYAVRSFQNSSGCSLDQAFFFANSFALILFIFSVTWLLSKITSSAWLALPILVTPYVIRSFVHVYLPDFFYAALVGVFFMLIYRNYWGSSLLLLILIYFTRENALFLCVALFLAGLFTSRPKWAGAAIIAMVAGITVTSLAGRGGPPHPYQMNHLLYLALKLPKNVLYNVFGTLIWTNVYADVGHPVITFSLPSWLSFGTLHTIGICPPQPLVCLNTLMLLLTTFGVAPTLLVFLLKRTPKQLLSGMPLWLMVAMIYGISSFIFSVAVSYDVMRLLGYAYPAFWLAVPALFVLNKYTDKLTLGKIMLFHVMAAWLPWLINIPWFVDKVDLASPLPFLLAISGSLIFHYCAIRALRNNIPLSQPA